MVLILKKGATEQEMEQIKQQFAGSGFGSSEKKLDTHKHVGKLKLPNDPIQMQKKLRDEWE